MAKKEISGYVKLQIKGGQANPAPPVGPALGQRGINIMEFCCSVYLYLCIVARGKNNSSLLSVARICCADPYLDRGLI